MPEEVIFYDIGEGDDIELPDGDIVIVQQVDVDHEGLFFTCEEKGESVYYYCKDIPSLNVTNQEEDQNA